MARIPSPPNYPSSSDVKSASVCASRISCWNETVKRIYKRGQDDTTNCPEGHNFCEMTLRIRRWYVKDTGQEGSGGQQVGQFETKSKATLCAE